MLRYDKTRFTPLESLSKFLSGHSCRTDEVALLQLSVWSRGLAWMVPSALTCLQRNKT